MSLWTLDGALPLIRNLQPKTRDFGYHLCLGGGVLNKGESNKDLDLVFCPLDNGKPSDPAGLLSYLEVLWGRCYSFYEPNPNGAPDQEDFSDDSYSDMPDNNLIYRNKVKFFYDGTDRIDVFIMAPVIDAAMQTVMPWTVEQAEAEANAIHDELMGRVTLTSEEDARIRGISTPQSGETNWVRRFFDPTAAPAHNSRFDGITITPADLNRPTPSQYVGTWEGITRSTEPMRYRMPVERVHPPSYLDEDVTVTRATPTPASTPAPANPNRTRFENGLEYWLPSNRIEEIRQMQQLREREQLRQVEYELLRHERAAEDRVIRQMQQDTSHQDMIDRARDEGRILTPGEERQRNAVISGANAVSRDAVQRAADEVERQLREQEGD